MFKLNKVVLIALLFCSSVNLIAEEMPESPTYKAKIVEDQVNLLLQRALLASATDLNDDQEMYPVALILRHDGKVGSFGTAESDNNSKVNVNMQVAHIRKLLVDLAQSEQILASVLAMYATVKDKNGESRQGISFEVEHIEGVSIMRFVPVSEEFSEQGNKTGKLIIETNIATTVTKPKTVFANLTTH